MTAPTPERLSAAELIDLVLDEDSWTSWDVAPVRGVVSAAYAAELDAAMERAGPTRRCSPARAGCAGAGWRC